MRFTAGKAVRGRFITHFLFLLFLRLIVQHQASASVHFLIKPKGQERTRKPLFFFLPSLPVSDWCSLFTVWVTTGFLNTGRWKWKDGEAGWGGAVCVCFCFKEIFALYLVSSEEKPGSRKRDLTTYTLYKKRQTRWNEESKGFGSSLGVSRSLNPGGRELCEAGGLAHLLSLLPCSDSSQSWGSISSCMQKGVDSAVLLSALPCRLAMP